MNYLKNILTLALFNHFFLNITGQDLPDKTYFGSPLDIDLVISANFAEIRADHFHSGIDLRTQGVTGYKVIATADGYISRIMIETGGYGKTLYLAHPNGKTTVYAHLDRFRSDINDYVKNQQYIRNSHTLNIFPGKNEWNVKKGEVIAYSGNSGNSSGPHLHFEIRNTRNQKPENVLEYNFNIQDTTAPRFASLWLYSFIQDNRNNIPAGISSFPLKKINGGFTVRQSGPLVVSGLSGFGIEAYDYLNGANNKCGLYAIEMLLDDKRKFVMIMDDFSFGESRYINSFIDYREKITNDREIQKLFMDPNNELSMYKEVDGQGLIDISDRDTHTVRIIIKDAYLNTSELVFSIICADRKTMIPARQDHLFRYDQDNLFDSDNVFVRIPAYSLYTDINFSFLEETAGSPYLSDLYYIHDPGVPVHTHYELAIRPDYINDTLRDKALILSVNKKGVTTSEGGIWNNGSLKAQVRHFGVFAVAVDTVPPVITPLNITRGMDMTGQPSVKFKVVDDMSGIKTYDGYIDNEWVLFEYDAKNDLVFYSFDKDRLRNKTDHELELYIIDNKDNLSYFDTEFYW